MRCYLSSSEIPGLHLFGCKQHEASKYEYAFHCLLLAIHVKIISSQSENVMPRDFIATLKIKVIQSKTCNMQRCIHKYIFIFSLK